MIIELYKNTSEKNVVHKTLEVGITLEGTIRDDAVDIMNPVITVNNDTNYFLYNYAYIPEFKRYYFFAEPPRVIRTGVCQLILTVDVLMSFKGTEANGYSDGFLGNTGYVISSTNYANFYLNDGNMPVQQNTKMTTHKVFLSPFSTKTGGSMVLNCTNLGGSPPPAATE